MKKILIILFIVLLGITGYKAYAEIYGTNLVAYWNLDSNTISGSTLSPAIGAISCTITGATATTGKLGQALSFNGTSGRYVDCGNNSSLYPSSTVTLSAWFYVSSGGQNASIVGTWNTSVSSNNAYLLFIGQNVANSKPSFTIEQSNNTQKNTDGAINYNIGKWNHLVGVADGSYVRLYLNGVPTGTPTAYDGTLKTSGVTDFWIGKLLSAYYLNGSVDDVRLYNTALSASEVMQLYQSTAGTFNNFNNF